MDGCGFMKEMMNPSIQDISKLPASVYFETDAGKKMIQIISKKASIRSETSFTMQDWNTVKDFEKNPLYQGRHFFQDMEELGFDCQIISFHVDEAPIKTYLFEAK